MFGLIIITLELIITKYFIVKFKIITVPVWKFYMSRLRLRLLYQLSGCADQKYIFLLYLKKTTRNIDTIF